MNPAKAPSAEEIFAVNNENFAGLCLKVFTFQYEQNAIYRRFCELLQIKPGSINDPTEIPFLPISLFKTHRIMSGEMKPEVVFESSGTTGVNTSRHFVGDARLYRESFNRGFERIYGSPERISVFALLPSYLEKGNSSLVYMVEYLCRASKDKKSGFYAGDHPHLMDILQENQLQNKPTLLIGVTYALLDMAEKFPADLSGTIVMETGGMKGRKMEIPRAHVHEILRNQWNVSEVHSEYGMTELLSQAYSTGGGIFQTPPWMKMLCRQSDDPFYVSERGRGAANIIDLANVNSCSFIAVDDLVTIHLDAGFEVHGRLDHSDLRGCNLLFAEEEK